MKKDIEKRINLINQELMQAKANVVKLEGHLGEAQHWLIQLNNPLMQDAPAENHGEIENVIVDGKMQE